ANFKISLDSTGTVNDVSARILDSVNCVDPFSGSIRFEHPTIIQDSTYQILYTRANDPQISVLVTATQDGQLDLDSLQVGTYVDFSILDFFGCLLNTPNNEIDLLRSSNLPTPIIIANEPFCAGESAILSTLNDTTLQYEWSDPKGQFFTGSSLVLENLSSEQSGTYTLSASNDQGCESEISLFDLAVEVVPNDFLVDTSVCANGFQIVLPGGLENIIWSDGTEGRVKNFIQSGRYNFTAQTSTGCITRDTFTIGLIQTLNDVLPDTSICEKSFTTMLPAELLNITWENGSTEPERTFDQEGTYSFSAETSSGCPVEDEFRLRLFLEPEDFIPDTTACANSFQVVLPMNFANINWNDGTNSKVKNFIQSGNYAFTAQTGIGCPISDTFNLALIPVPEDLLPDTSICDKSFTTTLPADLQNIVWDDGSTRLERRFNEEGIYSVSVEAPSGCIIEDEFRLQLFLVPEDIIADTSVCANSFQIALPIDFVNITWNDGDDSNIKNLIQGGTYDFMAQTQNGCAVADTFSVELIPVPEVVLPDTFLVTECVATSFPEVNLDNLNYDIRWTADNGLILSCDNCPAPSINAEQSGVLGLRLSSSTSGCIVQTSSYVSVQSNYQIYIPNAFSPNFDGVNDGFTIYGKNNNTLIESMEIFTRWGDRIFFKENFPANDPDAGWNGQSTSGDLFDGAVYVYRITVQ
ncbi:MAG: gliding motility-associated C-terminal domain-containing protein, partial [Bacteroidota bacterium]